MSEENRKKEEIKKGMESVIRRPGQSRLVVKDGKIVTVRACLHDPDLEHWVMSWRQLCRQGQPCACDTCLMRDGTPAKDECARAYVAIRALISQPPAPKVVTREQVENLVDRIMIILPVGTNPAYGPYIIKEILADLGFVVGEKERE